MIEGNVLVNGAASGPLLVSDTALSFWGGVDTSTGEVIDRHHPLFGANLSGCVLAIPNGRGSCSGSGALLETILNDRAPAAIIFSENETILTLGVLVAEALFNRSLPMLRLSRSNFESLEPGNQVLVRGNQLITLQADQSLLTEPAVLSAAHTTTQPTTQPTTQSAAHTTKHTTAQPAAEPSASQYRLTLSTLDKDILAGKHGDAARLAMDVLLRIADIQGADALIDVTQAHIDACIYHGPSSLGFAEALYKRGARFAIPTTLNAISVDQRNWRQQGISEAIAQPASELGNRFMAMGAQLSYTCAPYLLDTTPTFGEQIVWAESNAVMFANSVLGARTQKYPDFLDVFIALTGRAPASGAHLDKGRNPTVCIKVDAPDNSDETLWPLLGYYIGLHAGNDIPMITGLQGTKPSNDDLKAFSAAYATTGSSSMFHMDGITPEADNAMRYCGKAGLFDYARHVTTAQLLSSYRELNTATDSRVDAVCLGNPHFSADECATLATLCNGRTKDPAVKIMVTLGRGVYATALATGSIAMLDAFGVQFITDTCWCMISDPIIPPNAKNLMTNSGKYAHYGPALVKRGIHFGTLADCVDAACCGSHADKTPPWLQDDNVDT